MTDEELVRAAAMAFLDDTKNRCIYVLTDVGLVNLESAVLAVLTAVAPAIRAAERERCARVAEPPMQELLLHAGELTAAERRVAKAVLGWTAANIRALADAEPAAREGRG